MILSLPAGKYHLRRESTRRAMKVKRVVRPYPNYLWYYFFHASISNQFSKRRRSLLQRTTSGQQTKSLKTSSTMLSILFRKVFILYSYPTNSDVYVTTAIRLPVGNIRTIENIYKPIFMNFSDRVDIARKWWYLGMLWTIIMMHIFFWWGVACLLTTLWRNVLCLLQDQL